MPAQPLGLEEALELLSQGFVQHDPCRVAGVPTPAPCALAAELGLQQWLVLASYQDLLEGVEEQGWVERQLAVLEEVEALLQVLAPAYPAKNGLPWFPTLSLAPDHPSLLVVLQGCPGFASARSSPRSAASWGKGCGKNP